MFSVCFLAEMARDSTLGHQKRIAVMPNNGGGGGGVDVGLNLDSGPLPAVSSAESQEILEVSIFLCSCCV